MTSCTPQACIAQIMRSFHDRRWRGGEATAVAVVRELEIDGAYDREHGAAVLDDDFLAANDLDRAQVLDHLGAVLGGTTIELAKPFLVPIETIDSFAAAATVSPASVVDIANPLDLPEDTVKRLILSILADSHVAQDWGGERDDIHTALAELDGRRVRASFLLKGRGLRGPLKPTNLGKNGDQLTRLVTQPAELFVVQHVGVVDSGTVEQLKRAVQALRYEGNERTVGSVWDGTDCARLFAAHGLIDAGAGRLTDLGAEVTR
jgi:hypothetical protein